MHQFAAARIVLSVYTSDDDQLLCACRKGLYRMLPRYVRLIRMLNASRTLHCVPLRLRPATDRHGFRDTDNDSQDYAQQHLGCVASINCLTDLVKFVILFISETRNAA
jgi:hypothetical protein